MALGFAWKQGIPKSFNNIDGRSSCFLFFLSLKSCGWHIVFRSFSASNSARPPCRVLEARRCGAPFFAKPKNWFSGKLVFRILEPGVILCDPSNTSGWLSTLAQFSSASHWCSKGVLKCFFFFGGSFGTYTYTSTQKLKPDTASAKVYFAIHDSDHTSWNVFPIPILAGFHMLPFSSSVKGPTNQSPLRVARQDVVVRTLIVGRGGCVKTLKWNRAPSQR